MKLIDMKLGVESRVDDTVLMEDLLRWLNDAKDHMAIEVNASFPDIQQTTNLDDTFVFDARFHLAPVLYACARFKEQQSSIGEANNFTQQYIDIKNRFVAQYELPMQYREDRLSQQFTAIEGQSSFTITKLGYDPNVGDLAVYVNGAPVDATVNDDNTFLLVISAHDGDSVTAVWEEHTDFIEPPYKWTW